MKDDSFFGKLIATLSRREPAFTRARPVSSIRLGELLAALSRRPPAFTDSTDTEDQLNHRSVRFASNGNGIRAGITFKLLKAVIGSLIMLVRVLKGIWLACRPTDLRPVNTLTDLLAQGMRAQWRKAATEQGLLTPAPIPVGWSLSALPVAGPVAAAVGCSVVTPPFPPLPGQARVTEEQLWAGGGRVELFALYAGLAAGRVVVVGEPGAGKSGAAVLLLLDALEHRDRVDHNERSRVPVPVLLTAHGWDPTTCSVRDWLAARLAASYPLFQHRGGQAEAAAMVAAGAVALILDGLDEMDVALRPAALQALSDAPFRVVVLTRSAEMIQAASNAWLVGAVAVQLHEVTGPQAADYLQRARVGPPPAGWTQLLSHLRERPNSALTRGLSTPLALTLIRDTYRPDDDVSELLDVERFSTAADVEQYLIARVLPYAYAPRPGRPAPRYSLIQAKEALAFLARQMTQDKTRDLAWWHIPQWAPTTLRILASTVAGGLLGGLLGGLAFVLEAGLRYVVGHPHSLWALGGFLQWLVFGLGVGLSLGLWFGRGGREPKRVRNWRAISLRSVLTVGLASGLTVVLVGSFNAVPYWLVAPVGQLVGGLVVGLVALLGFGLMPRLAGGFVAEPTQGPFESWRDDRAFRLQVGVVFGVVFGVVGSIVGLLVSEPRSVSLFAFLLKGLIVGVTYGITSSVTWSPTLAWLQLQFSRHVPAVGLMSFLDDARDRGILRTVGAVYQFRHATLQDQLAGADDREPAISR